MKLMNKKIFGFMVLLSVTGYGFGYQFTLTNKTKNPLIIMVTTTKGLGGMSKYVLINSNQTEAVKFDDILCLESLAWAQFDPEDKFQKSEPKFSKFKGKNLMEIAAMGGQNDPNVYKHVFAPLAGENATHSLQIRMIDNPAYEQVQKAASTTDLAKIIQAATALASTSLCKNRSFTIIDTGKEAMIGKIGSGYNELIAVTVKGE